MTSIYIYSAHAPTAFYGHHDSVFRCTPVQFQLLRHKKTRGEEEDNTDDDDLSRAYNGTRQTRERVSERTIKSVGTKRYEHVAVTCEFTCCSTCNAARGREAVCQSNRASSIKTAAAAAAEALLKR